MLKPASLRAVLCTAFDELATDPGRLRMWIEQGHIICNVGPDENIFFTQAYKLTVVIEGWCRPSVMIWAYVLDWLRIQQPDLLTPHKSDTSLPFEVDIIDNQTVDISFDLALTEPVRVTRRDDGGFDLEIIAESDPLFPDMAPILPSRPLLKSVSDAHIQIMPDLVLYPET